MSGPIVECVANVSEGRRKSIIDELSTVINAVDNVRLLHVDPGWDANRTVFTFAGQGAAVLLAAKALFAAAVSHIDMREHRGNHPRMGVVDVCPFVPLKDTELMYCVSLARELGRWAWEKLGVPVYFYEAAASANHRRNLAEVRKGEYEGLAGKMKRPEWRVDCGDTNWNERTGTAIIGARPFLIAWNINLATQDVKIAKALAARLRGSGKMVLENGVRVRQFGLFPGLKAIGWELKKHGICQVSTNVVAPDITSLFAVMEQCRLLAASEFQTVVTGSELIGLVPEKYLLLPETESLPRIERIESAVNQLGFADLEPFDWRQRVLEELLG
jgi:glutamate formiminotransferase/formiminotetrahydrofolate cyclodeaminase